MNKFYNIAKNDLFKINRSITGNGTKQTLNIIKKNFKKLKIKKFKSGTKVFDWVIPPEWNVSKAYVLDKNKKKIIDFSKNNLHLVSYSSPINRKIKKKQLLKKIYSLKNFKSAIPYVTSYYKKNWGFCISHYEKEKIKRNYKNNDFFKVTINSKFNKKGNLNYGELYLKGKTDKEILITTYICHPSMANNELSGPIVSMQLINFFQKRLLNKSLRFLFIPETIGSIAYISKNLKKLKKNVVGGYVLTCIGDDNAHSCILTKYKNSPSDYALLKSYNANRIKNYKIYPFNENGSDERQFNYPGVDIPIAGIFRSKFGEYKEYHTSKDDFNFISEKGIMGGYKIAKTAIQILLKEEFPISQTICEPFLTKKKLYETINFKEKKNLGKELRRFLVYCDGKNSINQIAKQNNFSYEKANMYFKILKKNKVIK